MIDESIEFKVGMRLYVRDLPKDRKDLNDAHVRIITEVHKEHTGKCPGHFSSPPGDHIWFSSNTYIINTWAYDRYTLLDEAYMKIKESIRVKSRFELIEL